jgi:FdhD protein
MKIERIRNGARSDTDDDVAVEAPLEIRVGGKALTVVMRTPGHDEELARGFLFAESLIDAAADIVAITRPEALTGDEVGNVVDVTLRAGARAPAGERLFYASSSCGVCGKNAISALRVRAPADLPLSSSLAVPAALIGQLPERLRAAQPMFARTGGVHASGLFAADGTLELVREDVGRHNALDKLIGWALERGRLPLADCILVVSGRVSYEIVQKAIAAGLPLLAAVGAPSTLAIDLAEQFAVTLVGFVRDGGMNVYSHGDRVL